MYFCHRIGEKFGFIDALAYYFALYRKDLGNLFGISSI